MKKNNSKVDSQAVFANSVKLNIDHILETFFERHEQETANGNSSLYWSEKALAELSGVRSTLFFLLGDSHELVRYADAATDKIIHR